MNNPESTTEKRPDSGPPDRRQLMILFVVSGAVLILIAAAILVYLGLRGAEQPSGGTPIPTEAIEPTPTPIVSPIPELSCEIIISSGDVEMRAAVPVSLTLQSATYSVGPIVPQEDAWTYPPDRSGEALWVCGTVVNYVIGLEPTAENQELLGSLASGDEIKLELTSGTVLSFRFAEQRDEPPGTEFALAQKRPRLTLVLPRTDAWRIATCDYVSEAESIEPPPSGPPTQPGQPVQVGQARVTMNRGYVERSDSLSQGTAYYLTEFTIENAGEAPIATDTVAIRLRDSLGNTYLVSRQASEAGEAGPLSGEIQPGASAQGSAGFLVPDPLPAGELTWIFSLSPGSMDVRVGIPYEGGTDGDAAAQQPEVTVSDAFLSNDGNTVIIEGEVRNGGVQPLIVERADVTLSSSAGTSELLMAAPSLPWTIQPRQSQVIELQYQRPDASTVLLEMLGYSFEIGGLQ